MRAKTSKTSKERREKNPDVLISHNVIDAPPRATRGGVATRSGATNWKKSAHYYQQPRARPWETFVGYEEDVETA